MSLISCKHCGQKVSHTAPTCPSCGGVIHDASVNPIGKIVIGFIAILAILSMFEDFFKGFFR